MSSARYIVGDVFKVLRSLPDASVDLVFTSPPFLALRSYLPADHPEKSKEIGSEPTPGAYLDTLLDVVVECRRVLAPHGSLVFELGDTFAGSGGAGGDYNDGGMRDGAPGFDGSASRSTKYERLPVDPSIGAHPLPAPRPASGPKGGIGWPLDKSLCLIPQSFAWALSYGRNPFTGREVEPWRVRNVVAWCRPNPPVGALGDKFRPATSYLTVACMARDRYFNLDAVRTEYKPGQSGAATRVASKMRTDEDYTGRSSGVGEKSYLDGAGAPPLDYWVIPTQPYKGSHYATFPTALVTKPVEAMCPRKVCRVCGEPSRRIVGQTEYRQPDGTLHAFNERDELQPAAGNMGKRNVASGHDNGNYLAHRPTLGWTDCGHDDYRPGLVLDPFAGSGTTLEVATGHGRDAIGIDLDERNALLAEARIGGLFLTVENPPVADVKTDLV